MVSKDLVEQANEYDPNEPQDGEEFPDFVDPSEFEAEDWIAYHSDELWEKYERYRERCHDAFEEPRMTYTEMCWFEHENSLNRY